MSNFGAQNMISPLARVLVRAPSNTMAQANPTDWHYGAELTQTALESQHRAFIDALEKSGAEIIQLDADNEMHDAVFTHDPSLACNAGALLLRMGKSLRGNEVAAHEKCYTALGVPILGRIAAPGTVEGGDCLWLDDHTLIVGRGFRTNQSGIEQLSKILEPTGVTVIAFDLPVCGGEAACLHLMSIISLLDRDLALVYKPLLPTALYQLLLERGVEMVVAPEDEFHASGMLSLNVLAIKPRHGIMIAGQVKTQRALENARCTIATFDGSDLCIKCEGGPTCLTRPLLRT